MRRFFPGRFYTLEPVAFPPLPAAGSLGRWLGLAGKILVLTLVVLATTNGAPADWHLTWSDDFNGPAAQPVDPKKWTAEIGGDGWGNQEWEFYTDHNAALDGAGNLAIVARKVSPPTFKTRYGPGACSSARLVTKNKFAVKYGRIEIRMKIPAGEGLWPAFWMMGANFDSVDWPDCGEIDVMANIGREPSVVHGTMHGPGYSDDEGPTASFHLGAPASFSDDFPCFRRGMGGRGHSVVGGRRVV